MATSLKDVILEGLRGELTEASERGLSSSTKVTHDPSAQDPVTEAPGAILSDSLAAESKQQGGAFGSNSTRAEPIKQSSRGTTTNVDDTKNVTKLAPAEHASQRDDGGSFGEDQGDFVSGGGGKNVGRGPTYNVDDNDDDVQQSKATTAGRTKRDSGHDVSYPQNGSEAPSYVTSYTRDQKPKGRNLTEGGIDGSEENTSFSTDIGGEDDPSRLAEQKLRAVNAENAADTAARQTGLVDEQTYGVLEERAA